MTEQNKNSLKCSSGEEVIQEIFGGIDDADIEGALNSLERSESSSSTKAKKPEISFVLDDYPVTADFDYEFLPPIWARFARDKHIRLNCPPEYVAGVTIPVISAICGDDIGIYPLRNNTEWIVSPKISVLLLAQNDRSKCPLIERILHSIINRQASDSLDNKTGKRELLNLGSAAVTVESAGDIAEGKIKTKGLSADANMQAIMLAAEPPLDSDEEKPDRVCNSKPRFLASLTEDELRIKNGRQVSKKPIDKFDIAFYPVPADWQYSDLAPDFEGNAAMRQTLIDLSELIARKGDIRTLHFSDEAQPVFDVWWTRFEQSHRTAKEHEAYLDFVAKFKDSCPALALNFELFSLAARGGRLTENSRISLESLELALNFCDFLLTHTLKIFDGVLRPERALARLIYAKISSVDFARDEFTAREFYTNEGAALGNPDEVVTGLELLNKLGKLTSKKSETKPKGGRPKITYSLPHRARADSG